MSIRGGFVRLHRWVGLTIAGFLTLSGLTGSVIAFNHELDEWLNPELFLADTLGTPQAPLDLAARAGSSVPGFRVTYVPLEVAPGHAIVLGLTSRTDARYLQLFIDPVSGARLGEREWGVCCLSRKQAIPFIYSLHYTLHLPGVWGVWVMGIIGILWAVDCFVGFYLTLPAGRRTQSSTLDAAAATSFWARWKPAWRVKLGASAYRINFDLHRAIGLWFWAVLLTLAVSGVYLALPFDVVRPALSKVVSLTPSPFDPASAKPAVEPRMSYAAIVATAREEAARRGWAAPFDVFHSPEFDLFGVGFGDHHAAGMGVPYLYFDAQSGAVRQQLVPGEGHAGDIFLQWMFPLHSGQAAGLAGRILISLTGVAVAVLSATGVVIWSKKRRGRRALARRVVVERAA